MNTTKHESSNMHVTGKATFIDDMLLPVNNLYGHVVTTKIARGKLKTFSIKNALDVPGVKCILSHKDIPGTNQMGLLVEDEPILVNEDIDFIGQALFIIAATNETAALKAEKLIEYETEELKPIITIEDSIKNNWNHHATITMEQGDIDDGFADSPFVIEDTIESGAQEHWYLETQVAVSIPNENNDFKVYSSTQHPSETQELVAKALGLAKHKVEIETRRIGGGFGGKETQANMVAIWASLLANKTQQTIKFRLNRIEDQTITGKRHPFLTNYKIGFNEQGEILAYKVDFNANAGYSLDLSLPILARARTHAENAYYIPNIKIDSTCWKTNLPSNTAFRGFGAPQGIFAIEYAIEQIAQKLQKDAAEIRKLNFYKENSNNTTPYGQQVKNNRLHLIFEELIRSSDYYKRKESVNEFNSKNAYKKRGIAVTPVKFGISFNTPFLNQAGSLVNIYTDGSVLVNHGGIEMGQGLYTKIQQIVSVELGIVNASVKVNATNTSKVPNTSATAASSGTDLNGMAALNGVKIIKERLALLLCNIWDIDKNSISNLDSYFIYSEERITDPDKMENSLPFVEVIKRAYLERISLSAQGFYATPNLSFNKETQKGNPFHYFVFGLSISEIELDILTGRHLIIQTDILHDAGNSINADIDKGQIEGAFIQGVGWCTTEEIKWNEKGVMLNNSPDTYKIPGVRDIPNIFNVQLLKNSPNLNTVNKSKAVGEPPFIHGLSVFFAIDYAVSSVFNHLKKTNLMIPATNEKILTIIAGLKK